QADQDGTQSQPSSSTVPPPPTSQPAPTKSTTIPPTPVTESTSEPSSPSTAPEHETMEHPFEQPSPEHQPSSPRQESDIPQTQAPDSEDEATPKQGKSSGETDISPQGLEAAETLAEALSQIKTKRRNVKTGVRRRLDAEDVSTGFEGQEGYHAGSRISCLEAAETLAKALSQIKTKRRNVKAGVRRRLDAEDVSIGFEDVSTGFEDVSTSFEDVSTGFTDIKSASEKVSLVIQDFGPTSGIRAEDEDENARREELKRQDALAAKRLQEELELSKAQKKRMAQVQEAA
ncbi:hypothetical protein Tco_1543405, partial [Tanacetum coccineum]